MPAAALLTLVNDRAQFDACQASLRRDVDPLPSWLAVEPNPQGWNAAQGLNHGIERLDAEWIICVHQDVLFPAGFWAGLMRQLASLAADVAVAGIVGCERSGRYRGHIVDPNGHCYWPSLPHDVLTVDEVLIALRKTSLLRYDEAVPGFHCYGADLCFQAHERGLRVVAIDAPLVHLSTGKIDVNYERASEWLLARWGERHGHLLPMPAATLKDPGKASLLRRVRCWWRQRRDRLARNTNDCGDPRCAVRQLGEASGLQRARGAGKN